MKLVVFVSVLLVLGLSSAMPSTGDNVSVTVSGALGTSVYVGSILDLTDDFLCLNCTLSLNFPKYEANASTQVYPNGTVVCFGLDYIEAIAYGP